MTQLSLFSSKPKRSKKTVSRSKAKVTKRTQKRTSSKAAKKTAKTTTKKSTRKTAKKPIKKTTKKPSRTTAKKSAKKSAPKSTKQASKPKTKKTSQKVSKRPSAKRTNPKGTAGKRNQKEKASAKAKKPQTKDTNTKSVAKPASSVEKDSSNKQDQSKPQAKPRQLTPTQQHNAHIFSLLKQAGVAKEFHLESTKEVQTTLWSYLQFPHYADDMETYCIWYKKLRANSFYRVPIRDTSVGSTQKLADQRPRILNSAQLSKYLSHLTSICMPDGSTKLFGIPAKPAEDDQNE